MQVKDLGEFGLIAALMAGQQTSAGVVVGAGDDAAVVEITPGKLVVYTCDCMVENVHFVKTAQGSDVGFKLMMSNVSDIAAMGGQPRYAVVTVVAPHDTSVEWLQDVYKGIRECSEIYGVAIVGGDTSKGGQIMLNVTLIGEIDSHKAMLRKNALPGDIVAVTGSLGGSAAGLRVVLEKVPQSLPAAQAVLRKHYRPQAQVSAGLVLAKMGCVCANDISDGLASEAREIAHASGVAIELDAADIPIDKETHEVAQLCQEVSLEYALYGGEDYELVFCVPQETWQAVAHALPKARKVGIVKPGQGVHLRTKMGLSPLGQAYNHFS